MQALTLSSPRKFQITSPAEPGAPGPHEALVHVRAVGLCGTDISGYRGKMPVIEYPRVLGHELGVEVLAVGEEVTHIQPGDRCAVEPYLHCGECSACQRGHTNCCENLSVLGVHVDGGLQSRLVLPAALLHPGNGLDYEQLALVETLATGCHAVNRVMPHSDETVLVLGAGPVGLGIIAFARLCGATVHVIEPCAARREFLRKHGDKLTVVHDLIEPAAFAAENHGQLASVVFDATGSAASMARAIEYAVHAGAVVYVGTTSKTIPLDGALFNRREITLLSSRNAIASDFSRTLRLLGENVVDVRPWITHRIPLEKLPREFPKLYAPGSRVIKAIVGMA